MAPTSKFAFVLMSLIVITSEGWAQNTIRGVISERETGQVLQGATISIQLLHADHVRGTTTDQNGFYQLDTIDRGTYTFTVSYVGYTTFRDTISIEQTSGFVLKNVRLNRSSEELGEVTVSDSGNQTGAGQINVRPELFGRSPSPGGSSDLVGYIQSQPGVLATGDRGGQLFVRGGMPSENLILMDGTLVYQPFHIVGFFSVFPEDVVSSVDFFAGGFGPRYSGRVSSVMDVRLKNGNLYEKKWSASLSPFISDFYFETPVREGESSLMVSLRGSLIEQTSQIYLADQQPLKFNSQLAKFIGVSNTGVNCSAMFLRTYDRGKLDFESDHYFKWNNVALGSRCAGASEGSSLSFMELNFGVSYFSNETGGGGSGRRFSNIFRSNLDFNFAHRLGNTQFDYGFFTNYRTVNYDLINRFISLDSNEDSFLSTGGFLSIQLPIGESVRIEPGIVAISYMNRVPASIEPRLRFSFDIPGLLNSEIHGAAGIYRQPIIGLSDFRDAGTAFTAWMLQPDSNRSLQTVHFLGGWKSSIGPSLKFSVEGYHKQITDTPVSVWNSTAEFATDIAYADGTVNGFDVRVNIDRQRFYSSLGYGYSIIEYKTAQDHFSLWFGEAVQEYNPSHDRRHQFNAQAGFEMGNLSANISWSYGSGMPFTRPAGFDTYFSYRDRPPDVTEDYGTPRILLDKPFQGRLPVYHRLDLSLEQTFELSSVDIKAQLGAINVYDQNNLFYYDVYFQRGINQLPIVPYFSLKVGSR